MKRIKYGILVAVGMLGTVLSVPPMYAQAERSIEYQLALLGNEQPTQAVASANSVSRFRTVLDELSLSYRQSREEMGYSTIAMWKKLQEQKVTANLMEMLDGMNLVASGEAGKQDFMRNMTLYYALRSRGMSHKQTLRQMLLLTATK
ncbi:hypothetical protein GlitD10_1344 [Gloeomargarita lithophora Alchichica-D10]|uniref:Uncharacterized protein n=1 Tax=Gloeomargarita lithophora Alchichica-D10 TaxID=1188229 RepID=A0A1J0ACM0_9CYAN|nr:hypothetical protein [Gloeomargarita lithophora]APB33665.1 hypothetical protein GlitD10_1344 [Gloeomargarita lithophora Alchichica-D10]